MVSCCNRRLYKGDSYEICLPITDTGVTSVRFYTSGDVVIEKEGELVDDMMCFELTKEELDLLPDGVLRYAYDGFDSNTEYVVVTPGDYSGTTLEDIIAEAYDSGYTAGQEDCSGETIHNQTKFFNIGKGSRDELKVKYEGGYYMLDDYSAYIKPDSGYTGLEQVGLFMAVWPDEATQEGYNSGVTAGYASGYSAGQADCSGSSCNLQASKTVYLSGFEWSYTPGDRWMAPKYYISGSPIHISADTGYDGLEEIQLTGYFHPNEAYDDGFDKGYASGYSAGQTACTDGRTYLTFTDLSLDSASWNTGSTIYLWPNTNSNWDGETCKSVRLRTSKDGVNWSEEVEYTSAATFEIAPGESLMFDGSSNTTWSFNGDNGNWRFWCFSGAGNNIEVGGDISSLIGFREMTLPGTFMDLFMRFTKLHSAKHLVFPFSAVPAYAFNSMFYKCTGLQAAPSVLPAMTLGEFCYGDMFWQTAMVRPPALPATVLAKGCYEDMFYDSMIWSPPELPATVLAERCYNGMFMKSNIRYCPELPATNLAPKCYMNMFDECSAIVSAATLPAEVLAEDCYWSMFYDCNGLVETPVLPAKVLTQNCYMSMFVGCDLITGITCLATDISASGCTGGWLTQIGQSGVFYCDPSMVNTWQHGFDGVPANWTIEPYIS